MNAEERIEQEEKQRTIILPKVVDNSDAAKDLPLSIRQYDSLEVVRPEILKAVKEMTDSEIIVIGPAGGMVQIANSEYGSGFMIDDLAPLPTVNYATPHNTIVDFNQIPIMIDEKPATEHDGEKEFDFGRLPQYKDYSDSVIGQQKPEEQVLAIPVWNFVKLALTDEGTGELNYSLYTETAFVRRAWCEKDERFIQFLPYITFWKIVDGRIQLFTYQRGKGVGEERLAMGCSVGVGGHVNPIDFFSTQSKLQRITTPSGPDVHSVRTSRMLCEGFWTGILNNVLRESEEEVTIEMRSPDGIVHPVDLRNHLSREAGLEGQTMEKWLFDHTTFFLDYAASDVEKVHLAMMVAIQVPEDFEMSTNEEELIDVGFVDLETLYLDTREKHLPTPLECWSRSVVDSLYETIAFTEANKAENWFIGSKFMRQTIREGNEHPIKPEAVAKIPMEDRWKIGTLAGSFDEAYRFYAMNTFIHV